MSMTNEQIAITIAAPFLLANIGCVVVGCIAAMRARRHKREARGSASYAREARADAARSAEEAKKVLAEANQPADVLPFPQPSWYEGDRPECFN